MYSIPEHVGLDSKLRLTFQEAHRHHESHGLIDPVASAMPPTAISGTILPIWAISPRVACRVPWRAATCPNFVGHHAGHFSLVVQVLIKIPVLTKKKPPGSAKALISSESMTLMINGTLASEFRTRFWPIRFTYSVTIGFVDNLGLAFHLLGHLLAQRDLFFDRVRKLTPLPTSTIADLIGIFFLVVGENRREQCANKATAAVSLIHIDKRTVRRGARHSSFGPLAYRRSSAAKPEHRPSQNALH